MPSHSLHSASQSSPKFLGEVARKRRRRSSSFYAFSIGLKSRLYPFHGRGLSPRETLAALLLFQAWHGAMCSCSQAAPGAP